MAKLTPDSTRTITVGGEKLTISQKIIPWGAVWPKDNPRTGNKKGDKYKADQKLSGGTGKPKGITIHNTSDLKNVKDAAEQYTRATWPNANMNDVRVHYYVDDVGCWQNLSENEVGWHAADGVGPGNQTTIAIEIIMNGDNSAEDKLAEKRGAMLAAHLLNKYGLGIDKLYTHNHWMGLPDSIKAGARKNCPIYILPHWTEFKKTVSEFMKEKTPAKTSVIYRVQTGAFISKFNASALQAKIKTAGFDAIIVKSGIFYKVQVGAYSKKSNATAMVSRLKSAGFDSFITLN